jgi:hypothetical protein
MSKIVVSWDIEPCSLVEIDLRMEAVSTFETSINLYETIRSNIPGYSHLLFTAVRT